MLQYHQLSRWADIAIVISLTGREFRLFQVEDPDANVCSRLKTCHTCLVRVSLLWKLSQSLWDVPTLIFIALLTKVYPLQFAMGRRRSQIQMVTLTKENRWQRGVSVVVSSPWFGNLDLPVSAVAVQCRGNFVANEMGLCNCPFV